MEGYLETCKRSAVSTPSIYVEQGDVRVVVPVSSKEITRKALDIALVLSITKARIHSSINRTLYRGRRQNSKKNQSVIDTLLGGVSEKEKKLEERLVEVMALCSLQRQQKLTCLLAFSSTAIRHSRS